ncbi:ferredoxin [Halosimplex sp. J119]
MTTEYRVRLDREACDGVFACLVRDDRFVEATDGLAEIASGSSNSEAADGETVAAFDDDRLAEARQAASACPVDAIDVTVVGDE